MADLNKAVELSAGVGRTACQAFCQRGDYESIQSNSIKSSSIGIYDSKFVRYKASTSRSVAFVRGESLHSSVKFTHVL